MYSANESIRSILRSKMKTKLLWKIRAQYIVSTEDDSIIEEEEVIIVARDINEALRRLISKVKESSFANVNESYQPKFNSLQIVSVNQIEEEVYL